MPTIETRRALTGAVTYRAKVRLKGAPPACASFTRKTDATKWAQSTEVAIREERYFKTAAAKRCTLADTIDRYVREVLPRKPRTAKFQARQLAWWRKELGHLFLADVTPAPSRGSLEAARAAGAGKRAAGGPPPTAVAVSPTSSTSPCAWEWLETNAAQKECSGREGGTLLRRRVPASAWRRKSSRLFPDACFASPTGMRPTRSSRLFFAD
jgi:hypothetical protein